MMYDEIRREVDRLFAEAPDRFEEVRRNPVTGARWLRGGDPIGPQKRDACRALKARAWFAQNGPQDVQPLPLSYDEREALKSGGSALQRIVACFGGSLEDRDYAYDEHPSFPDFARGVLASPDALVYHGGPGAAEALPAPHPAWAWVRPLLGTRLCHFFETAALGNPTGDPKWPGAGATPIGTGPRRSV